MRGWLEDLRYGFRILSNSPGFACLVILTLGLGVGTSVTVFTFVNAILLKPLPYADPSRLMFVWSGKGLVPSAPADFNDWRTENQVFQRLAAFDGGAFVLTGVSEAERIAGTGVTSDLFPVLGVNPIAGRTFTPDEDVAGRNHTVVLSHDLASRLFNTADTAVGQTLRLNGESFAVIGVMPAGFRFPTREIDLWVPLSVLRADMMDRARRSLKVVGRLKDGVTAEQAQAQMQTITARLALEYPNTNKGITASVTPMAEFLIALTRVRPTLLMLFGAVVCFLLIACANVANLLLARGARRRAEIGVRVALGASTTRVVRQLLTESVLLGLLGGVAGVLLAFASVRPLIDYIPRNATLTILPQLDAAAFDGRVLIFAIALSIVTGVLFGLAPARDALRLNLREILHDARGGKGGGPAARRSQRVLVIVEVALAVVLLVAGGLMVKSLLRLNSVGGGLAASQVLTMSIALPAADYAGPDRQHTFFRSLIERVESLPGVQSASAVAFLPLSGSWRTTAFSIESNPTPPDQKRPQGIHTVVLPNYFKSLGLQVLRGRDFSAEDSVDSLPIVIVNDVAARRFWPDADPLGKRVRLGNVDSKEPWRTVVGVVDSMQTVGEEQSPPELYVPSAQESMSSMTLVVRAQADPQKLTTVIRREIATLDKNLPVSNVATLEDVFAQHYWVQHVSMSMLLMFATLAVFFAGAGIYAVMSYIARQRTYDIGIRMALGASQGRIVSEIVYESLRLAIIGTLIGLVGALLLTRLLATVLVDVKPTDPIGFISGALVLTLVAVVATLVPAYRASRINPLLALKRD